MPPKKNPPQPAEDPKGIPQASSSSSALQPSLPPAGQGRKPADNTRLAASKTASAQPPDPFPAEEDDEKGDDNSEPSDSDSASDSDPIPIVITSKESYWRPSNHKENVRGISGRERKEAKKSLETILEHSDQTMQAISFGFKNCFAGWTTKHFLRLNAGLLNDICELAAEGGIFIPEDERMLQLLSDCVWKKWEWPQSVPRNEGTRLYLLKEKYLSSRKASPQVSPGPHHISSMPPLPRSPPAPSTALPRSPPPPPLVPLPRPSPPVPIIEHSAPPLSQEFFPPHTGEHSFARTERYASQPPPTRQHSVARQEGYGSQPPPRAHFGDEWLRRNNRHTTPRTMPLGSEFNNTLSYPMRHNRALERFDFGLSTAEDGARFAKAADSLSKFYGSNKEQRYSGAIDESLMACLHTFKRQLEYAGISDPVEAGKLVPLSLTGPAAVSYRTECDGKQLPYEEIFRHLFHLYNTPESTTRLNHLWENTTIATMTAKLIKEGKPHTLEIVMQKTIAELQRLQNELGDKSNDELHTKLLKAVETVEETRLTMLQPPPTVTGLIHALTHTARAGQQPYKPFKELARQLEARELPSATHYTDRTYNYAPGIPGTRSQGHDTRRNQPLPRPPPPSRQHPPPRKPPTTKVCFVCFRRGCYSSNHTQEERDKAWQRRQNARILQTHMAMGEDEEIPDQIDEDDLEGRLEGDDEELVTPEIEDFSTEVLHMTMSKEEELRLEEQYSHDLNDAATFHAFTHTLPVSSQRWDNSHFYGVMIDTGAARGNTAGEAQVRAMQRFLGPQSPKVREGSTMVCKFGIGTTNAMGTVELGIPIGSYTAPVTFHVIPTDTPFIMCINEMDRLGVNLLNTKNRLVHDATGEYSPITRFFDHPFLLWNPVAHSFFTMAELQRLHRRFNHPSAEKLWALLRRADEDREEAQCNNETRAQLEEIVRLCSNCNKFGSPPKRFKFRLKDADDAVFNRTIVVDVMFLDYNGVKLPTLHIADEATGFNAARFIPDSSTKTVWQIMKAAWMDTYIGPPEEILHDAGTNFMSREFKSNAAMLAINCRPAPVESHTTIGLIERFHAPLRRAWNIIQAECPATNDADKEANLQASVKAVNDSSGPNGLIPTLLVFGTLPRLGLPHDNATPSITQRAAALRKAIQELNRTRARRTIQEALHATGGPNTTAIRDWPLGGKVMVYRNHGQEHAGWEGPFVLAGIDGESCVVDMGTRSIVMRTTHVRPFKEPTPETIPPPPIANEAPFPTSPITTDNTPFVPTAATTGAEYTRARFAPSSLIIDITTQACDIQNVDFTASRRKELNGLLEKKVFEIVPIAKAKDRRIYGTRFVDEIKHQGTPDAMEKSRLVVQGYNDRDHGLLTHAPTVQRASQRLAFALAVTFAPKDVSYWVRDVSQAYVQSETEVSRDIYVRAPKELGLAKDQVLHILRPLYGLPESALHWWKTYHGHHVKKLGMSATAYDSCLLHTPAAFDKKKESSEVRGVTCMQTDDTLNIGNKAFLDLEENNAHFLTKPREFLEKNAHPVRFNGATLLRRHNGSIEVSQPEQIAKVRAVAAAGNNANAEYASQRARGAYIASTCRPDQSFAFALAAQHKEPKPQHFHHLNAALQSLIDSPNTCLRFMPQDPNSVRIAVFVDASFAGNEDHSSQMGIVVTTVDDNGIINVVHWISMKCRRVARSVLSAELFAMAHGFDIASALKDSAKAILGRDLPLCLYTDSKSLYDSLVSLNSVTEKRLLIDLRVIREAYERREVAEVFWIPGKQNPADALTKATKEATATLQQILKTNRIKLSPNAWVERKDVGAMKATEKNK